MSEALQVWIRNQPSLRPRMALQAPEALHDEEGEPEIRQAHMADTSCKAGWTEGWLSMPCEGIDGDDSPRP